MDYLTLCQELRREASVAGDGPTTVIDQISMLGKLVSWVKQAWIDIQLDQTNWLFMNSQFNFNTVAAQRDYTAAGAGITDLKYWDTGSFLIYDPTIGESDQHELIYLPYGKWRDQYRAQMGDRDDARPTVITLKPPNNAVRFETRPDAIYTIDGDYKRSTQIFAANTDVPTNLPDDLHYVIVWKALMYYADDQNAPDAMDKADNNFAPLYHRMLVEQLADFDSDFEALA